MWRMGGGEWGVNNGDGENGYGGRRMGGGEWGWGRGMEDPRMYVLLLILRFGPP